MRKRRRHTRHTLEDNHFRHRRTTIKDPDLTNFWRTDSNPQSRVNDIFSIVDQLEDRIYELERRQKHFHSLFEIVFGKLKCLSRMHQYTRDIATKLRSIVCPIPNDAKERILEEIRLKKVKREQEDFARDLSKAYEIKKLRENKELVAK